MRIAILASAVLALSTANASALDLQKLSDKLFECDGVAVKFASKIIDEASPASESRGYAVLDLVETIVMPEGESGGRLSAFAREQLGNVKSKAGAKAQQIVADCDIGPDPTTTVDNPFSAN